MNKQDKEDLADLKLREMQSYLNEMESEIGLNQDANLAKLGMTFGKLQGVYKEIAFFRNLYGDNDDSN